MSIAETMETTLPYVYIPLENPKTEIRLISILSTTPRICCEFKVVSLEEKPVFGALSYMWGDATIKEAIDVGGRALPVTQNLAQALRDVYTHWSNNDYNSSGRTQWLWTDALCIDQDNTREKDHQVPLMEVIYPSAYIVFAWQGVEDEVTRGGIQSIELVAQEISDLPCYNEILEATRNGYVQSHRRDCIPSAKDLRLNWERMYTISAQQKKIFEHIEDLLSLPYWTRVWIFQEIVLADKMVIISGANMTSWRKLIRVLLWVEWFGGASTSVTPPESMPGWEYVILMKKILSSSCVFINLAKLGRARGTLRDERPLDRMTRPLDQSSQKAAQGIANGYFLHTIVVKFRATNPKDYVYGFAGITGARISIDYSKRKTIAEVYHEFAALWLQAFSICENNEAGRQSLSSLWFLGMAGHGFRWPRLSGLASWAPYLAAVAEQRCALNVFKVSKDESDTIVPPQNYSLPRLENTTLHCSAVFLDYIVELSPRICTKESVEDGDAQSHSWLLWMYDYVAMGELYSTADMDFFFDMANVLLHQLLEDEPMELDLSNLFVRWLIEELQYVCAKRRDMTREYFLDSLDLQDSHSFNPRELNFSLEKLLYERRVDAYANCGPYGDWCREHMASRRLDYGNALGDVNDACFCITDRAYIGLCPPRARPSDHIFMVQGYDRPVVLRRQGDGYVLMGACYFQEFLDGEDGDKLL
jgi:hypothetical protein